MFLERLQVFVMTVPLLDDNHIHVTSIYNHSRNREDFSVNNKPEN